MHKKSMSSSSITPCLGKITLYGFLLVFLLPLTAQDLSMVSSVLPSWENQNNGFFSNKISAVERDLFGRLWVGTYGKGLIVKTATETFHYQNDPFDAHSLASNTINDILVLPEQQTVVLATNLGISLFDPRRDHFMNYRPGGLVIDGQEVDARNTYGLLYDPKSRLVWGSSYSVVFSFDPATGTICEYPANWEVSTEDYREGAINIYDIGQDQEYIYFCDLEHIWSLDKTTKEIVRIPTPGSDQKGTPAYIKGLYVNTDKKLGYLLRKETIWVVRLPSGTVLNKVDVPKWIAPRSLVDVDEKRLLISGRSGAVVFSKNSHQLGKPFQITVRGQKAQIQDCAVDTVYGITLGTRNHGLFIVAAYQEHTRTLDIGSGALEKRLTGALAPAFSEENRFWLAQGKDIQYLEVDSSGAKPVFSIRLPNQLEGKVNAILDVGSYLVVGSTEGLFEYQKPSQSFRKVPIALDYGHSHIQVEGSRNYNVYSLARWGDKIFVGAPRVFQLTAEPEQLSSPTALPESFSANPKGKLEVVEEEQLLWKVNYGAPAALDLQNGEVYELDTIFPFNALEKSYPFYFDGVDLAWDSKRQWLWAVGRGHGLFAFQVDRNKKRINMVWSLRDLQGTNLFDAIAVDTDGRIWVGSDEGLILYNPETDDSGILGYRESEVFPLFREEGLTKTDNGQMIAQTLNGSFSFWPDTLAKVLFTKKQAVNLDYYEVASKSGGILKLSRFSSGSMSYLELPGSASRIKMNFSYPEGVPVCFGRALYYRLDGAQNNLVKWDVEDPIVLSNLPPGAYRFQIFSQDQSSVLFEMVLDKHPAWYQRKLTYLLAVVLLGIIIFGIIRLRVATLKRKNRELQSIVADRTEKLRLEKDQAARQANELKRLNEQQEQLFVNVIHEFRTPLSMISAPLHSIRSYIKDKDQSRKLQQLLDIAERGVQDLDLLLQSLRHLLKKAEVPELMLSPFEPVSFFEEKAAAFGVLAAKQGINFEEKLTFINQGYFETDVQKISIILNNLLSNALKHTPPDGTVTLSVNLSASDDLTILVIDKGPGVPDAIKAKIFERFFQAGQVSKSGGLGIGLSIAKTYTELLKGKISVYSAQEGGAQFEVILPLKRCRGTEKAAIEENDRAPRALPNGYRLTKQGPDAPTGPKRKTIAIVEDHQGMQELFSAYLSERYAVQRYANGQLFINAFDKHATPIPDLVITDLMMPGASGFDVIKWMNANPSFTDLPVMVISAVDHYTTRQSIIDLGVYDFLPKPFFPEELIVKVQRLFRLGDTRSRARQHLRNEDKIRHNKYPEGLRKEVERIIQPNLSEDEFSVEDIARQVYLSKRHLNRLLKAECGMSVKEVLIEMRLQEAYRLLQSEPGIVIKDVSFRVGYNKPSYFSKIFRQRFGISPREVMGNKSTR